MVYSIYFYLMGEINKVGERAYMNIEHTHTHIAVLIRIRILGFRIS